MTFGLPDYMRYLRKSYDIAGYTYQAEILCPGDTLAALGLPAPDDGDVESVIEAEAQRRGIDYSDERSYDSGEFPKVVFVDQLEDGERCGKCGGEL